MEVLNDVGSKSMRSLVGSDFMMRPYLSISEGRAAKYIFLSGVLGIDEEFPAK